MTLAARVLLVEDEAIIAIVIKGLLENEGLSVTVCVNANEAWRQLQTRGAEYALVVLDRGLPDMDGMDLLRRIKKDPAFSQLPVIIETGHADKQSIREGLDNGAYYYLVKPFQPEILLAVVNAALQQRRDYLELADSVRRAEGLLDLLYSGSFRFRGLDQARILANNFARVCPQPERAAQGLLELLINAVEHGNLGISYADKSELLMRGVWQDEVLRRLQMPEYRDRYVEVSFQRQPDSLAFTIRDQGAGFDWRDYLDFSPERAFDLHGRGIAMAYKLSIDRLHYQGNGNTVLAIFTIPPAPAHGAGLLAQPSIG